ncbi:unnamed protein product [Lactuca virosa]|uniref:TIR domain-containing protein n=1 Tax=Lactuca virosa TaxID=75947 RepID=A0AAU9NTR3_9ASTR|nr:unnamed protein product [Lactuca virosa]
MMTVLSEFLEGSSYSLHTHGLKHDVFLSFRGCDTRHSFTNHLHKALIAANITVFFDDDEIKTGEDLKPELESAIKASRVSIIILSKNYADSSWCLDELLLILEQRRTSNQIVIPIFYHVEPTHIRKQECTFGLAMDKHRQQMEAQTNANKKSQMAQKIGRWRRALTKVANISGENVKGWLEAEFIDEIVKDICRRLQIPLRNAEIRKQHFVRNEVLGSSLNDKMSFGSLKILNLGFCEQLHIVSGFDELPALERCIMNLESSAQFMEAKRCRIGSGVEVSRHQYHVPYHHLVIRWRLPNIVKPLDVWDE